MEIDRESLFTMDNDKMEAENQEPPQVKTVFPWRFPPVFQQMAHPELLETFLPHRGMLYQYNGPRRMSLIPQSLFGEDCEGTLYRPSILSGVFPQGFDEIAEKKWLKLEIAAVIDGIIKKVHSLPSFRFLLRYAPLHSIKESWSKMAPEGSSSNEQRSASITPRSTGSYSFSSNCLIVGAIKYHCVFFGPKKCRKFLLGKLVSSYFRLVDQLVDRLDYSFVPLID
jgi:hypothetical protein